MNYLDYIANTFRINQHPFGEKGTLMLLSKLPKNYSTLLEIGSGTGHFPTFLSNEKVEYHGIDSSKKMIEASITRKNALEIKNCTFHHITNTVYPFDENYFDVVVCESVLAIQKKQILEKIVKEIQRVLKKDGLLILNEALWKENLNPVSISWLNHIILKKYGIVQAVHIARETAFLSFLKTQGFNVVSSELAQTLDAKTKQTVLAKKSKKFSRQQTLKSFLNPKYLFAYLYFKFYENKLKKYGHLIQPYIIVCNKKELKHA